MMARERFFAAGKFFKLHAIAMVLKARPHGGGRRVG